jgi:hypothetical protein
MPKDGDSSRPAPRLQLSSTSQSFPPEAFVNTMAEAKIVKAAEVPAVRKRVRARPQTVRVQSTSKPRGEIHRHVLVVCDDAGLLRQRDRGVNPGLTIAPNAPGGSKSGDVDDADAQESVP